MRRAIAAGLLLGLTAGAVRGQDEWASRELVADLEALAGWCTKKKLLRSRNHLYEKILLFEPDHKKARSWLRYEKREDKWIRPRPYREPRDFRPEMLPEFERRRAEIKLRFVERLWPTVEKGGLARARALESILTFDPDDTRARAANREVKRRGRWILAETATALKRRAELQRHAGKALAAVPAPLHDEPTAGERALGLRWICAFRGHWWRVVATRPRDEVRRALRSADAAADFVAAAIPDETRPLTPEGMRVHGYGAYYLSSHDEGMRFLARHRAFGPRDRKFAQTISGTWIPGTNSKVVWRDTADGLRDAACRNAVSTLLRRRYGFFKQGWIVEGFGIYLTYHLVGTRRTVFVTQSKYASDQDRARKVELWRRMQDPHSDWLRLAHRLRETDKPPDLRFLVSKGLNQMTVDDLLHAYAMAAYMVEGRPEGVSTFLAASVERSFDDALAEAFGITAPELEARVARWLAETR